jgi:hypothetical protein
MELHHIQTVLRVMNLTTSCGMTWCAARFDIAESYTLKDLAVRRRSASTSYLTTPPSWVARASSRPNLHDRARAPNVRRTCSLCFRPVQTGDQAMPRSAATYPVTTTIVGSKAVHVMVLPNGRNATLTLPTIPDDEPTRTAAIGTRLATRATRSPPPSAGTGRGTRSTTAAAPSG